MEIPNEEPALLRPHVEIERRGIMRRIYELVWQSDTMGTRFSLAFAATLLACASWSSDADCQYVGCFYLERVAPWQWWATGWTLYAALKIWRLIDGEPRPGIAVVVNIIGAFLYCTAALVLTLARWPYVGLSASSITLAFASLWVLMRTGINPGEGFRRD